MKIAVRATRGKWLRAEPVAALYAEGRISHVGLHATLEEQMEDVIAVLEGRPGPLVDGTPYTQPGLIAELETYLDRCDDARHRGGILGVAMVWLAAFSDSLRNGLGERLRPGVAWPRSEVGAELLEVRAIRLECVAGEPALELQVGEEVEDEVLEATLDAGAEDVNDLGESFEVVTEATDLVAVRTALQGADIDYDSADASFVPSMQIELDAAGATKVFKLIEALEDLDDVQNVFANFDVPDEVLEALDA